MPKTLMDAGIIKAGVRPRSLADAIARNRQRQADQAEALRQLRSRLGMCPDGPAVIDLAVKYPGTVWAPANQLLLGTITTSDGITGALLRELGGRWIQATEDMSRDVPLSVIRTALAHGGPCDSDQEEWCDRCGAELTAHGSCDNDHDDPSETDGAPFCAVCGEALL